MIENAANGDWEGRLEVIRVMRESKSERRYVEYNLQHERNKRVFILSLVLVVFLPIMLLNPMTFSKGMYYGDMIVLTIGMEALDIVAIVLAYLSLRTKNYSKFRMYIYWGVVVFSMNFFMFNLKDEFASQTFYMMTIIALGLCALYHGIYQVVWVMIEAGVGAMFILQDRVQLEQSMYICGGLVMAAIISWYSYRMFIQKAKNRFNMSRAVSDAQTDPMTKLLNRRGVQRCIDSMWNLCARQKIPVAVLMMDIDNFKKYNDTFGHAAGDECIRQVADKMKQGARRKNDIVARVGGEEFMIILSGVSQRLVMQRAETIRNLVNDMKIAQAKGNFCPYVSISMGIVYCDFKERAEFTELYKQADGYLYQAKSAGKNCIVMDGRVIRKADLKFYA